MRLRCLYCHEWFEIDPREPDCVHHCLDCCDCCTWEAIGSYDEEDEADERQHVLAEEGR